MHLKTWRQADNTLLNKHIERTLLFYIKVKSENTSCFSQKQNAYQGLLTLFGKCYGDYQSNNRFCQLMPGITSR